MAWPHIDHPDRFVRWAALIAIQRLPVDKWAVKTLQEKDPGKRVNALLSLAKAAGIDPFHRQNTDPPINQKLCKQILQSLLQIEWKELTPNERLALVRTYQVAMVRFGKPSPQVVKKIINQQIKIILTI